MPSAADFICPLSIPHEITVDKTLWEEEYETTYVSGGDITVEDLISGKELTFNKEDDMVIFLEDNEEHVIIEESEGEGSL